MNKFITVTWQLLAALLNIAAIVLFLHMLLFCQHTSVYRQVTWFPAPFFFSIQYIQSDSEWWRLVYGSLKIKVENDGWTRCIKRNIRALQKRITRIPLAGRPKFQNILCVLYSKIISYKDKEVDGTEVRQRTLLCQFVLKKICFEKHKLATGSFGKLIHVRNWEKHRKFTKMQYWDAVSWRTFLHLKINKYYILWVCNCSLRYPACNAHAPHCYLWPTIISHIP
jgi:hypothetical protein